MCVGSSGLVMGLTDGYVKVVSLLAALLCQRYPYEIGRAPHEEGAFVVDESLQRVSVSADRTGWMREKGKWAKIQRLPACSHCFILWYRDTKINLKHLI